MTKEGIKEFTGNEDGILVGYVSGVEKNKFFGLFERNKMTSIQLEQKKKKLNLEQKKLLCVGKVIKLDFNDGKLYFMNEKKEWV